MKTKDYTYRHISFPFGYCLFGLFLLMLFGWKVFLLFPFLMMFAFWGSSGRWRYAPAWQDEDMEKPKRKPKHDDWDEAEIV